MTQSEFDSHAWKKGDKVIIGNTEYPISYIDFDDRQIYVSTDGVTGDWFDINQVELPRQQSIEHLDLVYLKKPNYVSKLGTVKQGIYINGYYYAYKHDLA